MPFRPDGPGFNARNACPTQRNAAEGVPYKKGPAPLPEPGRAMSAPGVPRRTVCLGTPSASGFRSVHRLWLSAVLVVSSGENDQLWADSALLIQSVLTPNESSKGAPRWPTSIRNLRTDLLACTLSVREHNRRSHPTAEPRMLAEGRIDCVLYPTGASCAQLDVSPYFMVEKPRPFPTAAQLFEKSQGDSGPEKTRKTDPIHRFRRWTQILGSAVWALAPVRPF